jgi:hypothetical protein
MFRSPERMRRSSNRDGYPNRYHNANADPYRDSYANKYSYSNADTYRHADGYVHRFSNVNSHPHPHAYRHGDLYRYGHCNTTSHSNAPESSTPTCSLSRGNERRQPGLILWYLPPPRRGKSETPD